MPCPLWLHIPHEIGASTTYGNHHLTNTGLHIPHEIGASTTLGPNEPCFYGIKYTKNATRCQAGAIFKISPPKFDVSPYKTTTAIRRRVTNPIPERFISVFIFRMFLTAHRLATHPQSGIRRNEPLFWQYRSFPLAISVLRLVRLDFRRLRAVGWAFKTFGDRC